MHSIPRSEHPRPQFVRENWMNLNGQWEFQFDFGNSGMARKLYLNESSAPKAVFRVSVIRTLFPHCGIAEACC